MRLRGVACAACLAASALGLVACGPVAPAEWAAVGAIAGAAGAAFSFDDDLLRAVLGTAPAPPPQRQSHTHAP